MVALHIAMEKGHTRDLSRFTAAISAVTMRSDVVILGAGMAGASLAYELAVNGGRRVTIVEIEAQPGRHSTGRSAAMFFESYGNPTVRALTRASRHFLEHPPAGVADVPLLTPRSCLFVADAPRLASIDAMFSALDRASSLRRVDVAEALERVPILRRDWVAGGLVDETGHDIDVAALHQGYLRMAKRAGAVLLLGAGESRIERNAGRWTVDSCAGSVEAPILVNATGAWADQLAVQLGARPVGLQPMRRTAVLLPAPLDHDIRNWPLVVDIDERFYFKPDAGKLLLSPANEDPMPPCDVMPEEIDVALAVDRFERATTVRVDRVGHRWAGLRSFVADRSPVVGFDAGVEDLFWLAGQGGYGIQTAPGLARLAAGLLTRSTWPLAPQVAPAAVAPSRAGLKSRAN